MRRVRVLPVKQPIGTFYIGSMTAQDVCAIAYADVRRLISENREVEDYLGIQRRLSKARQQELQDYVNTADATFPTAIILAVDENCASLQGGWLTLEPAEDDEGNLISEDRIAKVLDGQHRIAGLIDTNLDFEVNVAIFVGLDIADQATIFATVNLAQTKVNKSLAFDLVAYQKARSPQKTAHNIVVELDRKPGSPLYRKIKRLGVRTEGRTGEFVSQGTLVDGLMPHLSGNPMADRDALLRRRRIQRPSADDARDHVFRALFLDEKDAIIANVVWNYFDAIKDRWPEAWESDVSGIILTRTTGFRAFLRFLRPAYIAVGGLRTGNVSYKSFFALLNAARIDDSEFNRDEFLPGTSGESKLYKRLVRQTGVTDTGRYDN